MGKLLIVALALALAGCTDAERADFGAYGEEAGIYCYSGGKLVFEDQSTGRIQSDTQGIFYKSKATGRYIRAYADCIVVSK
jgi:hypothetical protein